jgi:hypothetical protein
MQAVAKNTIFLVKTADMYIMYRSVKGFDIAALYAGIIAP